MPETRRAVAKAANDKELDPCGDSNAPCLRPLVAQPQSDARVAPGHPPAARMHRVSPRVQSYIVSLFDYVIKTVSLSRMHQQQAKEEVRRGGGQMRSQNKGA